MSIINAQFLEPCSHPFFLLWILLQSGNVCSHDDIVGALINDSTVVARPNGNVSSKKMGPSHGHPHRSLLSLMSVTFRVFRMPYPLPTFPISVFPKMSPEGPLTFAPHQFDSQPYIIYSSRSNNSGGAHLTPGGQ